MVILEDSAITPPCIVGLLEIKYCCLGGLAALTIIFAERLCSGGIEEVWRVDCGSIVGLFLTYVGMAVKDSKSCYKCWLEGWSIFPFFVALDKDTPFFISGGRYRWKDGDLITHCICRNSSSSAVRDIICKKQC